MEEPSMAQMYEVLMETMSEKHSHDKLLDLSDEKDDWQCIYIGRLRNDSRSMDHLTSWLSLLKQRTPQDTSKNIEQALELRTSGNNFYSKNDMMTALRDYNKSIVLCPRDNECFSLSLFNRCMCLKQLYQYAAALASLDMAFDYGYPLKFHYKAFYNKADCLARLGRYDEASQAVRRSAEVLKESGLSANNMELFRVKLRDISNVINSHSYIVNYLHRADRKTLANILPSKNKTLLGASNSVEIRHTAERGRHIVCTTPIAEEEVIFVEEPFVFVPVPVPEIEDSYTCELCGLINIQPYPCLICSTSYCSEKCRLEGWSMNHQWECPGYVKGLWKIVGVGHIAARMLLNSFHTSGTLLQSWGKSSYTAKTVLRKMRSVNTVIRNRKYREVYQLQKNLNRMTHKVLAQIALGSILLERYLTRVNFTEYLKQKLGIVMPQKEMEILISVMMMDHMGIAVTNGTLISTCKVFPWTQPLDDTAYQISVGAALYPSSSIMNHSCNPNIMTSHCGSAIVVKASENIKPSEEVTNCYAVSYKTKLGERRRTKLLKQYGFECDCRVCTNPTLDNFCERFQGFLCTFCEGPVVESTSACADCHLRQNYARLRMEYEAQREKILRDACDLHQKLNEVLALQRRCMYQFNDAIHISLNELASFHFERDDFLETKARLIDIIPITQYRYGIYSEQKIYLLYKIVIISLKQLVCYKGTTDSLEHRIMQSSALQLVKANIIQWHCLSGPWTLPYIDLVDKLSWIFNVSFNDIEQLK